MARTKKGTPPKYQINEQTGRAKCVVHGKTIWLGQVGTPESMEKYKRCLAIWEAGEQADEERKKILAACGSDPTVIELIAAYMVWAEGYYRKNGRMTSEIHALRSAFRPLKERFGMLRAADFSPLKLAELRDWMAETRMTTRNRGGKMVRVPTQFCRNVINRHLVRVRGLWSWAVGHELVPEAVAAALGHVPGLSKGRKTRNGTTPREKDPIKPVSDQIVDITCKRLPSVVADMVQIQRLTGMRPAEVCGMRAIDIMQVGRIWKYQPETHKTEHHGKSRIIALGPRAQEIVQRRLKPDMSAPLFQPKEAITERRQATKAPRRENQKPSPRKTARVVREAYDSGSYRNAIHRACRAAGVPEWSPNQLRHTVATKLRATYGPEAAQVILGHANLATTEIYAERNWDRASEIMQEVG